MVVTDPSALGSVVEIVRAGLDDVERACSRFRPDSEISGLTPGRNRLSPMLADLVGTALDAAEASGGLVDPTVGGVVSALGYDRSIELLPADGAPVSLGAPRAGLAAGAPVRRPARAPAWRPARPRRDREGPGGRPDGAACGRDRRRGCAGRARRRRRHRRARAGRGLAGAGPRHRGRPRRPVTLRPGWAVATSSTVRRAWRRGGVRLHHIVDPRTAAPAAPVWRSATVAAPTCTEANTASTAAVILGHDAGRWLSERGYTARLVDQRHRVVRVGDWPREMAA